MNRIKLTVLGFLGFIVMLSVFRVSVAQADDNNQFRWDILGDGGAVTSDVASASDGSTITLTGSGTFSTEDPSDVTGGGTWAISGGGSGTFEVRRLIQFNVAPGTFPGDADARAGLVFLQIAYSDGDQGILVVGCNLDGTPANVLEGVTASKGSVDFWNVGTPFFTVFHVLP